jgi:OPA family glycerol-3-phosphate transporter-like MFS transporter
MDFPAHSGAYRFRRALNWVPLGFAYAFLYMGRYNLTVSKSVLGDALMTKAQFGEIFAVGAWVYALSFLVTGPLADRLGGRLAMLIGTGGALLVNFLMGLTLYGIAFWGWNVSVFAAFMFLYALNMHFQSYGAISIVTVKAPWFHVRERGTFSTIFGAMIAFGLYFAFDWGFAVAEASRAASATNPTVMARVFAAVFGLGGAGTDQNWWIFFVPAIMLAFFWLIMFFFLRNTPGEAGYKDFDTGEESVSETGERLPVTQVFKKILTHPVLLVVCGIEFCSGVLRNGIMQWYPIFASEVGFKKTFWVPANWGLMLLLAGLAGSFLTGWCSDKLFQSRRGPMAAILYGVSQSLVGRRGDHAHLHVGYRRARHPVRHLHHRLRRRQERRRGYRHRGRHGLPGDRPAVPRNRPYHPGRGAGQGPGQLEDVARFPGALFRHRLLPLHEDLERPAQEGRQACRRPGGARIPARHLTINSAK